MSYQMNKASIGFNITAFLSFVFLCQFAAGQVVLQEKYNPDAKTRYGANERHFTYYIFGTGYALSKSDTAFRMQYGWPNTIFGGFRYKLKLTRIFSTGLGLMIQYDKYRIKQDDNYSFTDKLFEQIHHRHQK